MKLRIQGTSKLALAFLGYCIVIWMTEFVDLIAFCLNLPQASIVSRVAVLVVLALVTYLLIQSKMISIELKKITYGWEILSIIFIILILGFLKGIMPDFSYDTGNYHLSNQNPGFVNLLTEHFALGNFQAWGFRLSDRLFFPFRSLLGFRMGTQLNTIILILSFLQIKAIIEELLRDINHNAVLKATITLSAVLITLSEKNLLNLGIYYVDIAAFPLGFEIIYILIKASRNEANDSDTVYFALLNGFLFASKMTNIVYAIPSVILYICLIKRIKIGNWIKAVIACIVPCSVYLVYNYICTSNPVFPYFNRFFQSPYFPIVNWSDQRWGATTLIEKCLWLVYSVFLPEYRQSEIANRYTYVFGIGLVALIIILVWTSISIKKRKEWSTYLALIFWIVVSSMLWGFTTGYERYFMFGNVVLAIIGFCVVIEFTQIKILRSIAAVVISFAVLATSFQVNQVVDGREWSWRNSSISVKNDNLQQNMKYLFTDQKYNGPFDVNTVKSFIIINDQYDMGYAHWMNPNSFIFNCAYLDLVDENKYADEIYHIQELVEQGGAYDLVEERRYDEEAYKIQAAEYSLDVKKATHVETNLGQWVFVELKTK